MKKLLTSILLLSCFTMGFSETTKDVFAKYKNRYFLETGSYLGDGIAKALLAGFERVYSIELSPEYYKICQIRFENTPEVELIYGDSSIKLQELLKDISEPVTFWLDGHYSGGPTAQGEKWNPILEELEQIKNHPIKNHTILIDDARLIGTNWFNFITIEELKQKILEINPNYEFSYENGHIQNDVLVAKIPHSNR